MKVFCREHERGFFAPRQNPIKCDNRGHILGELNFAGDQRLQSELHWQYCCNCEHFCPISGNGESLEHCPVCARRTSQLYICDRCFTISFESSTRVETKNFTLTADGMPRPACPGCLQTSSAELREHACDDLNTSFTTALTTCPICRERLDIGPSFPNLVSQFLRKTKATNKANVTFDYDTGVFVEIEDGEFVIVPDASDSHRFMVVPRLTQFSDPREFYEIYQDYYHHRAEIRAGEVFIHEPAFAERTDGGWVFKSQGLLEVVDDHPKRRARKVRFSETAPHPERPATIPPAAEPATPSQSFAEPVLPPPRAEERALPPAGAAQRAIPSTEKANAWWDSPEYRASKNLGQVHARAAEPPTPSAKAAEPSTPPASAVESVIPPGDIETEAPPSAAEPPKIETAGGVCQHCGSAVEDKYAFCWNCGKPMRATKPAETKRPKNPSRRLIIDMNDAPDLPPFDEAHRPANFSSQLSREQKRLKRGNGSGLKLMLVVMVAGVALISGMVGMWWLRPSSQVTTAALAAETATSSSQSAQSYAPTVAVSTTPVETPLPTRTVSADDELQDLRTRRTKGTLADRRGLMRDITRLEREYPNDYRFPYERAKMAASDAKSSDAAFQALFIAAQKAIKTGKTAEMLQVLEADKAREFRKLARGHGEWAQIVQSLKSRNATLLATNTHSAQALE